MTVTNRRKQNIQRTPDRRARKPDSTYSSTDPLPYDPLPYDPVPYSPAFPDLDSSSSCDTGSSSSCDTGSSSSGGDCSGGW